MIRSTSFLLILCVAALACAPTRPFRDLGPEPSLAPLAASIHNARLDTVEVNVKLARPGFVTVLAIERHTGIKVLASHGDTTSVWLNTDPHRLVLHPASSGRPTIQRKDPVPGLLASMGGVPPQPPDRIEGVGSAPLELCADATPYAPRYCPVPPTQPLYEPGLPQTRYLLFVVTEGPLDLSALRERLTRVDVSAEGRALLDQIGFYAAGHDARWAAYGIRR